MFTCEGGEHAHHSMAVMGDIARYKTPLYQDASKCFVHLHREATELGRGVIK